MGSKVTLTYENGKYSVEINGSVIDVNKNLEDSFIKFQNVIKNNASATETSWSYIEEKVKAYNNEFVEINSDYKTITLGDMKFFYTTGKTFYTAQSSMVPLIGGYELIKFILKNSEFNNLEMINKFLDLCKNVVISKANYRTNEESISVFSPAFNYGSVEYNFYTKKMNKGVAIESCSFDDFVKYTLSVIKKD